MVLTSLKALGCPLIGHEMCKSGLSLEGSEESPATLESSFGNLNVKQHGSVIFY